MASVNKAIIVGNLGNDPTSAQTQSGKSVTNFTVATTDTWTDGNGEKQERTEWHRVVAWGRLAEICTEYLHKGKQVYLEGSLQTREWEDKQGQKRYTTEVVAKTMQMLGRRGDFANEPRPAAELNAPVEGATEITNKDDLPF